MFSAVFRFGLRDVVEVPLDVSDVSLLQCGPQGKDRGKMVASHKCAVHEHCGRSEFFFCTQEESKGDTTSKDDSVKRIAARHQAMCELLSREI